MTERLKMQEAHLGAVQWSELKGHVSVAYHSHAPKLGRPIARSLPSGSARRFNRVSRVACAARSVPS